MTYSILTFDAETGVYAGAAATGSLCVGAWVLRGDIKSGLCASQGTAPSTFWRDDALRYMYSGERAQTVVDAITSEDAGRGHHQMVALDLMGRTAGFTGSENLAEAGHLCEPGMAVAGNMLNSLDVLDAMRGAASDSTANPAQRMLAALFAADDAGSDKRGLQSAVLLVLAPDAPPLDLRIDHSSNPLHALAGLLAKAQTPPYSDWLAEIPVAQDRTRAPQVMSAPIQNID